MQRALDIIEQIGCKISQGEIENIKLELSSDNKKFAGNFIVNNFTNGKILIGIIPGPVKKRINGR